jgi:hypothetical protein
MTAGSARTAPRTASRPYVHPPDEFKIAAPARRTNVSHDPSTGLSLLRHNMYTMSDVVQHYGADWLSRSLRILSDRETYGGSILHNWLLRTCHDERKVRLQHVARAHSKPWFERPKGPWVCSRASGKCTLGELIPGTTNVRPAPEKADLPEITVLFFDLNRTEPESMPMLTCNMDRCNRLVELAVAVQRHIQQGKCVRAAPRTTSVHLRVGDKADILLRPGSLWMAPKVPLAQQMAAIGACSNTTVIVHAVMHYLDAAEFNYNPGSHRKSQDFVADSLAALRSCGIRHELRSSPDVDTDTCFMATSDYFVSHAPLHLHSRLAHAGSGSVYAGSG